MKFKFIYAFGMLGMLTALSACHREYLNPAPQNVVFSANAFSTAARIANQVPALYATLKNGGFYGGRYIVYGDIRGEDFLAQDPNLVTNYDVWLLNPTNSATAVKGLWLAAYQVINACNMFIDGMDSVGFSVVGKTIGNPYVGEARLLRAISYYSLLQFYARPYADGNGSKAGVPLRLTGIKDAGFSDMKRSTVAEVYTQILSDLDFAEANLPLTNAAAADNIANVTRAHRNTAIALKTRVYLSMQKYDKVIEEANKIVPTSAPFTAKTGVANTLSAGYAAIFKSPYLTAESVLSMPFTSNSADAPGTQNDLRSYFYASTNTVGSIFSLNPSGIVGDATWLKTDTRRTLIDTSKATANLGKIYLKKYPTATPSDYNIVIRWAEVLLNLAEARVRNTNTVDAQAIDLLNAVHRRSDAVTLFTAGNFANSTSLINTILTERRIEFLGEGLRNNDLMRLLQTIPAKGTAPAKAPNEDGYTWPASSDEKALNKLWSDQ
jgi:starch-binding outer membrane protein, SusD/RagB family